jgi:hypothetical protein
MWRDVLMLPDKSLPEPALRLAIASAIVDRLSEETIIDKLFREDPERVRSVYREITAPRAGRDEPISSSAKRRERSTYVRPLWRKRSGLTVSAIADRYGMTVATLKSLLEFHGFLECVPYGGRQRRMLVSETAFHAEVGHNVIPMNRIGHLEGYGKAAPFPVFYEDRLSDIFWCLDYSNIVVAVEAIPTKRKRLAWLIDNHAYLPDAEVATLADCTERGVRKARAAQRSTEDTSGLLITPIGTLEATP